MVFPLGAALIGVLYIRLSVKLRLKLCLFTGVLWLCYSLYEYLMYTRVLCSGECNIRVDLLLIYPVLIALSAASTTLYYREKRKVAGGV